MDPVVYYIIVGVLALAAGIGVGKVIFAKDTKKQVDEADIQAQKIIAEAEVKAEAIKKEKNLEAKERFVQLKSEHDREVLEKTRKINDTENRVKQKEITINQKEANLDKQLKVSSSDILRTIESANSFVQGFAQIGSEGPRMTYNQS